MFYARSTSAALLLAAALVEGSAWAQPDDGGSEPDDATCSTEAGTSALREGMSLQRTGASRDAEEAYKRCLEIDPRCTACVYELGWSYAAMGEWRQSIHLWERVLEMQPGHEEATLWLPKARARARAGTSQDVAPLRVPLGTTSAPADGPIRLTLVARLRNWNEEGAPERDIRDPELFSPKSVRFAPDGKKVWINALEGYRTLVYEPAARTKIGSIRHAFDESDAGLFGPPAAPFDYGIPDPPGLEGANTFLGKPVEATPSHGGRFLWIPYYRRSWDRWGAAPSAVAVIDTASDRIVRVLPTGPIPKFVAVSPDGRYAAVVHWGDNTIGLIDTSSGDPSHFRYVAQLVVEERLPLDGLAGTDRDRECGFCLRGAVFTPDGSHLLVGRMGGGGIAGFDVRSRRYLGTVLGMKPTPRHLVLSPDGASLYVSSNLAGFVSRIGLGEVLAALERADGRKVRLRGWKEAEVGAGARTIEVSPDGRWVYAAVHGDAEIVAVNAASMKVAARVRTDAFPVGLDVSPDGKEVWVTAQGRLGQGGNSVTVYAVETDAKLVGRPSAP